MSKFTAKKGSSPWRISLVNANKSAWNCGFVHIYYGNPSWKTSFFVQWLVFSILLHWFISRHKVACWEKYSENIPQRSSEYNFGRFFRKMLAPTRKWILTSFPNYWKNHHCRNFTEDLTRLGCHKKTLVWYKNTGFCSQNWRIWIVYGSAQTAGCILLPSHSLGMIRW